MSNSPANPLWPVVPANGVTIVMFATHDRLAGGSGALYHGMRGTLPGRLPFTPNDIVMMHMTFLRHNKASAANGVRAYARDDVGEWRETDLGDNANPPVSQIGTAAPIQIPILGAGVSRRMSFPVSHLSGFAIEYTAGADNPEEWNGVIKLILRSEAVLI